MHRKLLNRQPAMITCCLLMLGAILAGLPRPATATPGQAAERLGFQTCELLVPGTQLSTVAQCGWLERPENPAEPDGRKIRVHVARIPARGRVAEPDPLVFFAGGPGQAASESWPIVAYALRKVNENRDILLVDQRGTGKSNPLKCPQVELEESITEDWDGLARATRDCLAALDADPRFYTTTVAMHDIDAARAALEYEQVNLFGGSYGTRAAQVYMRLFPDQVRSAVLDGVVPMTLALGTEHAQKLDQSVYRVLQGCDRDPDCSQAFPGTERKLREILAALAEAPVELAVPHPTTGEVIDLRFDRDVIGSSLRFLSYSADSQAMLPLLINEAWSEYRFDRLASQILIAASGLMESIAQGMELSVRCAEDYPWYPDSWEENDYLLGNLMLEAARVQCEIWPRGEVPADFHEPITTDAPVLLLSGALDPVTPPEYADAVAAHLPRSMSLVAPGQGHIATTRGCMGEIVSRFIADASFDNIDSSCMDQMQHTPYFMSLTGPLP